MRPIYTARPIGSDQALAAALGISVEILHDFASSASHRYSHFTVPKRDGSPRSICSPSHDLKIIQKRINRAVFGNVKYPDYLFGGIPERDYFKNASAHTGAKGLLALDILDFYPSIQTSAVESIFKHFCKFPDPVVRLLTQLTTLNGHVPQGACTSSHIANLVFHETEHRLVRELRSKGITYTRLLDDICISSTRVFPPKQVKETIAQVASLLKSKGFKLKGKKTRITSGSNPTELMEVTGLWLNRGKPRVKSSERKNIRVEMHRLQNNFSISRTAPEYHLEHEKLSGRVSTLAYVGHDEAGKYRASLKDKLPHFDINEEIKTVRLAEAIVRIHASDRNKHSYIDRYYQVMHRINILSRTNARLASSLRHQMLSAKPSCTREFIIYGTNN